MQNPETNGGAWAAAPSAGTHLHCVCLAGARLAIGKDTDVEAIDAGGDQGLHLLKYLGRAWSRE